MIMCILVHLKLEVIEFNFVSRSDDKPIIPPVIDHAAFSPDGLWLATVRGLYVDPLTCALSAHVTYYTHVGWELGKWWVCCWEETQILVVQWEQTQVRGKIAYPTHTHTHALIHMYLRCILVWLNQICLQSMYMYLTSCRYTLNTVVDPPHSNTITSLAFSPIPEMYHSQNKSSTLPMAVTTSLDGCFKLWISVEKEESKSSWACRSVSTYHDLPCYGSAFSDDGSLLVVNFSKVNNPPPTSHLPPPTWWPLWLHLIHCSIWLCGIQWAVTSRQCSMAQLMGTSSCQ